MTSNEIKQHLYVAMQEEDKYNKAFEIIKVFNESCEDIKETNKFALGIASELKKLYYQWGLAVKELNKETGYDIPENLFVFLIRKFSKPKVAKIMGWDKIHLKECPLFDSIDCIIKVYLKMSGESNDE
nr:MAG TPA: hypothetical protein [Caudoviricetes sp.]